MSTPRRCFLGSDIFETLSLIRRAQVPPWPGPAILSARQVEGSSAGREARPLDGVRKGRSYLCWLSTSSASHRAYSPASSAKLAAFLATSAASFMYC